MHLITLGINHTTAPLDVRERVAFPADRLASALQDLTQSMPELLAESAILSTCNRTEIYASTKAPAQAVREAVSDWLAKYHSIPAPLLLPHLYGKADDEAVRHAFRVACGLDSMVLGEPQILGQMKQAAREAAAAGTVGTLLHQLFQRSFLVAKDVRTRTEIGAQSVSMAAASVRLAQRIFERLSDQHVLFIGAGEMIELAATHFSAQSPKSMTVANRTAERAETLSARLGGVAISLSDVAEHLARYDIVVSCTASTLPIIGLGMVERATRQRRHRPMFMVDLAVPRDIEPEVGRLDDVYLYTLDDLGSVVQAAANNRQAAVSSAEVIIDAQVQQFLQWVDARNAVPMIRELHERAELLKLSELDKARRQLARGEAPEQVLEALAQGLTKKFLHGPTQLLNETPSERRKDVADWIFSLYPTSK